MQAGERAKERIKKRIVPLTWFTEKPKFVLKTQASPQSGNMDLL